VTRDACWPFLLPAGSRQTSADRVVTEPLARGLTAAGGELVGLESSVVGAVVPGAEEEYAVGKSLREGPSLRIGPQRAMRRCTGVQLTDAVRQSAAQRARRGVPVAVAQPVCWRPVS